MGIEGFKSNDIIEKTEKTEDSEKFDLISFVQENLETIKLDTHFQLLINIDVTLDDKGNPVNDLGAMAEEFGNKNYIVDNHNRIKELV